MNSSSTARVQVAGESLVLHPARAVWWPRRATLLLADTHFGKAATFRQAGLAVPHGTTARMLQRWTDLMQEFAPERVIILGDFVHSSTRAELGFESELIRWRKRYRELRLTLIRGNHDRGQGELFTALQLELLGEPHVEEPFALCHHPDREIPDHLYAIAGHLHPGTTIEEAGRGRLTLPCFLVGSRVTILPAFGEFTGAARTPPAPGNRLFVIAGECVLEIAPPPPPPKQL